MSNKWHIDTLAVQAGYDPHNGEPRVAPMTQSTTYAWETADQLADLFNLQTPGHIYSRLSNPTTDVLEQKMAALDKGVGALATASGQAAITTAILNIASAGDHVISSSKLYGGTVNLFAATLKRFGIETSFVNPDASEDEIASLVQDNTKGIYGEALANPALTVLDMEKFSRVAANNGLPLIVDNTLPTPALLQPKDFGASLVVYSATKYLEGHARALGGIIVDTGTFNWENSRFPGLNEPDPTYHGITYTQQFGSMAFLVKARVQLLRDMGAAMAPMNAWITTMGLETLHLRMERHSSNALTVAQFLGKHPKVSWINYPGLEDNPENGRAKKYLPHGTSGVLAFGVKGGLEAGKKFMEAVKLARLVVHVCDTRTSVIHPASTTHRQLNEEELRASGVTPDLIRLSVGIEHVDDIMADLDQALNGL